MTDKEYNLHQKRAKKFLQKWIEILGLRKDRFKFNYYRSIDETSPRCVMSTSAMWEYRNHTINVFVPEVAELPDEELEMVAIHELVHVLNHAVTGDTTGKSDAEIEKMEFATQSIAYAIWWAYEEGQKK